MSQLSKENGDVPFTCNGAREILELSAGAVHIEKTIIALERAVIEDPGLAFDLSKALIESICKTILTDKRDPIIDKNNQSLPNLIKYTTKQLELVPEEHINPQTQESFARVVNGLENSIRGLCEIRKYEGTASHGRDGYTKSLEPLQALFVARIADTIANFLFKLHKSQNNNVSSNNRIIYEDYSEFNDALDNLHECTIVSLNLRYKVSEVLFKVDKQAYINFLQEYLSDLSLNSEESVNQEKENPVNEEEEK